MTSRLSGRVKWFNAKLGYGFIEYENNDLIYDIFVHYSQIMSNSNFKTLKKHDIVTFDLSKQSGYAINVQEFINEWVII